jgi:hypothetical protein
MSSFKPTRTREHFDLNTVTVAGVVQKLWGHEGEVFARLRISRRDLLVETEDAHTSYVTLRFPEGCVGGSPITLQAQSIIRVGGYLCHHWIQETLRRFLETAGDQTFFEWVPADDLPAWQDVTFRRSSAILNVLYLGLLDENGLTTESHGSEKDFEAGTLNRAVLEGIISGKRWSCIHDDGVDEYARLAAYDRYTSIDKRRPGNFGQPLRRPHYVNVNFPDGKTSNGHEVQLPPKARLRIVGHLSDRGQQVTLHDALVRTGSKKAIALMQRLPGTERLHEISAQWETLHIRTDAAIVYTAGSPKSQN